MINQVKKLCNVIVSNHYYSLLILISLYSFQLLWLDKIPLVAIDEPWAGNTAYNVSKGLGFINTNRGMWGGDHLFLMPAITWVWIKLFGLSLFSIRFASFVCGIVTIVGWVKICKQLDIKSWVTTLVGSTFILGNIFFVIFHWGRPESLVCTLLIWAVYYTIKGISTSWVLLLSSFLLSIGCFAHPHLLAVCIVYALFACALAVYKKEWQPIIYSVLGVSVTLCIAWVFIQLHFESLSIFLSDLTQLSSDRSYKASTSMGMFFIDNIKQFIVTYCLGWKRSYILFFEIGILGFGLFQKQYKSIRYLSLAGLLAFGIGLVMYFFRRRYFGIILIFSYLVLAILLTVFSKRKNKKIFYSLIFFTGMYLANNLVGDLYIVYKNRHVEPFYKIEKYLRNHIPQQARVYSSLHFWTGLEETIWLRSLAELKSGDYVVLSDLFKQAISPTTGEKGDVHNVKDVETARYNQTVNYINQNGILLDQKQTNGYGLIQLWKIN